MCWHKWTKWITLGTGNVSNSRNELIGRFIRQTRECLKCGLTQIKDDNTCK